MELIVLFDVEFSLQKLLTVCHTVKPQRVIIYPLVVNPNFQDSILNALKDMAITDVQVVNMTLQIEQQLKTMRTSITKASSDIANIEVNNKSLKQHLMFPDMSASAWWLSLLSDTNTTQTKRFLYLAQAQVLLNEFKKYSNADVIIAIDDAPLRQTFKNIVQTQQNKAHVFKSLNTSAFGLRKLLEQAGVIGHSLFALSAWKLFLSRHLKTKKALAPWKQRYKTNADILFVTYFPYLDEDKARQGEFVNKLTPVLPELIKELGMSIQWFAMFVPYNDYNDTEIVNRAKCLEDEVLTIDEFNNIPTLLKGLTWWIKLAFKNGSIYRAIRKRIFQENSFPQQAEPIFKSLWQSSFVGRVAMQGILYHLLFQQVFKNINKQKRCLYYGEMQLWEKALNSAAKEYAPNMQRLSFQHSSFGETYWRYFYDERDLQSKYPEDMSLPDMMIANGERMKKLLALSRYPNLVKAEAIRQLHLCSSLEMKNQHSERSISVLIAGDMDFDISASLVNLVYATFPEARNISIVFKGHPALPFTEVFEQLNINPNECGYEVSEQPISDLLATSKIVISAAGTVGIEALASGCEVVVPIFPNVMPLSPLIGAEEFYHKILSSDDLLELFHKIEKGMIDVNLEKRRQFVTDFWCLDLGLAEWKRILQSDSV